MKLKAKEKTQNFKTSETQYFEVLRFKDLNFYNRSLR